MTQSTIEQFRHLANRLSAKESGMRTELTEFPSGAAMLDIHGSNGRAFVMAYSPSAGFGVDELGESEGLGTGYRSVYPDYESAVRELDRLLASASESAQPIANLNLVVVYADDAEAAMRFYGCLGLKFQAEQHGSGPAHFAAVLGGTVFEIYPSTRDRPRGNVRLGFQVTSLEKTVNELRSRGVNIVSEPKQSPWGRRAVVEDPDGNRVELTQAIAPLVSA